MSDDTPKKSLSEAQLRQRREAAAKSTGPRTPEGKARSSRNAYVTGEHSAAAKLIRDNWSVGAFARPCKSTCPSFPCSLVDNELTRPGGDCLDKTVYLQAFDALLAGLQSGNADSMHEVLAAEAAGAIELLRQLREEIAAHGLTRELPAIDREGAVILMPDGKAAPGRIIANPAISHYYALLDRLGINLPELLATPRAAKKAEGGEEVADAFAELMEGVARMDFKKRRPVTIDQQGD